MLKCRPSTSTKTGVAPNQATTSAVAAKVKAGTSTASPGPMPFAISASPSASVPLAQAQHVLGAAEFRQLRLEGGDLRARE